MDIDAETGTAVAPAERLPGMGPLLTAHAKQVRAWGPDMAVVLARKGEDGLLDEVTDDLLEGCGLRDVAARLGVKLG